MRKLIPLLAVTLVTGVSLAIAAEVKTITGEAVCAKCALKEQATCQNVVMVDEAGAKVNYYMVDNAVAKKAHGGMKICTAKKDAAVKVKVTGDVKEEGGKKVIDATEIKPAE